MTTPPRLRFAYFTGFTPGGGPMVLWDQPGQKTFDYLNVKHWIELAQALERAKFDAIFWADHSAVHDQYQGSWKASVEHAVQFPGADPVLLAAALAGSTTDLGFAMSGNIVQDHPYAFARKLATVDHLTDGRAAWNIVTSFQQSAWRNLGHDGRPEHSTRYEQAEEYLTVIYKLLEGSWASDAVERNEVTRRYADGAKVREINHHGTYYDVPGIQSVEPSPQRTPVLFQAGTSDDGRAFSARNAEAIFIKALNADGVRRLITDMNRRLAEVGRKSSDLLYFQAVRVVIGSTEEEAKRKDAELQDYLDSETNLVMQSSMMDTDLADINLDSPIGDFKGEALQGKFKALAESAPDKSWTFRQVVMELGSDRFVGTPEQLADHLEMWRDAGVHGINLTNYPGARDMYDFLEHAVPVLQARGLLQTEYAPGTLREKLFADDSSKPSASGPHLNERHPAAALRW